MATNKKHHYVPRFYLRRFASDGRSLSLYNFGRGVAIKNANLKNQCYRDYMYGKDGLHESNLSKMEGALAELLRRILSADVLPPPWSPDHESLCVLALLQNARTAYSADSVNEFSDKMWKKVLEKDPRCEPEMLSKVRIVNTDPANFAIATMLRMYHLIMDLDYRLLLAHDKSEFITSDNPVVMYNQLMKSERSGSKTGLACKGLQIFFPLSPRHMLVFFDRTVYAYAPRETIVATVPTKEDMVQLNSLQAASALENVYFSTHLADIYRVVQHVKHLRRTSKTQVFTFPETQTATGTSQIIGSAREDVRTNLTLTFVKLLKPAKRWLEERKKPGLKQAVIVRNPEMVEDHKRFLTLVEAGQYAPTDFIPFLRKKYGI